jgi:hypothetical protein
MAFENYLQLADFLVTLGCTRAIFKPLSENDNAKQQIYLGGSFEALNQLPFGDIRTENETGRQNFKASIELWWVTDDQETAPAPKAQLILYPKYPEVRLSGFLRGCTLAPSEHLRPIPPGSRTGTDGRILVLGVTSTNRIYAYLAINDSPVARSIIADALNQEEITGVFYDLPLRGRTHSKALLLARLREISLGGWHTSRRLDRNGQVMEYRAQNGGGYTLEALFGIIPNGRSEPDFMGWELKAFSGSRITLMTPEPDGGFYGINGVAAFVRKYGHDAGNDRLYFTGTHRTDTRNEKTAMTIKLDGFDTQNRKITNASGGIILVADNEEIAAVWSFSRLLGHWGRKHSQAAYVKSEKRDQDGIPAYRYLNPAWLGEGADFAIFLKVMTEGIVIYDPGSKVTNASSLHPTVKARSQFRINFRDTHQLYKTFTRHEI